MERPSAFEEASSTPDRVVQIVTHRTEQVHVFRQLPTTGGANRFVLRLCADCTVAKVCARALDILGARDLDTYISVDDRAMEDAGLARGAGAAF